MFLVQCTSEDGALQNLGPGTIFPNVFSAMDLTPAFDTPEAAQRFVDQIDPRTWEGPIVCYTGKTVTLLRPSLAIRSAVLRFSVQDHG